MEKIVLLLVLLTAYGCGDSDSGQSGQPTTIHVRPGQSIQAAIDAAPANATIMVEPGTYHESPGQPKAVVVTKNGIELIGLSTPGNPVVLENAGGQKYGIWVSPADSLTPTDAEHPPCGLDGQLLHNFLLKGFTVRGFDEYGVYLACADGFTLTENLTDADLDYGLFPVRSHNGTLSNNEATGTTLDSALYVGQSDHVTLTGNRAHDSAQGLEIENCSDIVATNNEVFNNSAGLIADIMPHLQKTEQTNLLIANNNIHDNNRPSTALPGDPTYGTPSGTGVVILGGSLVTVRSNTVANNGFQGIIMSSYCTGVPAGCTDLDIAPDPENDHIVDNQLLNNGSTPPDDPILSHFAADLLWDHTGQGNCWSGNTPTAKIVVLGGGSTLPACQ